MIRKVCYSRPGLILASLLGIFLLAVLGSMARSGVHAKAEPATVPAHVATNSAAPVAVEHYPDREAFFGDEHLHTGWSLDAWVFGNRITGPDDALVMPRGKPSNIR